MILVMTPTQVYTPKRSSCLMACSRIRIFQWRFVIISLSLLLAATLSVMVSKGVCIVVLLAAHCAFF